MKKIKEATLDIIRYIAVPGILMLIAAATLNIFVYNLELNFFHNVFNNEVNSNISLINRRFQTAMIAVESTRAFFLSSDNVTKEEFDSFAEVLLKNINSGAIAMPVTIEWVDTKNVIQYVYPINEDNIKAVGLDLNQRPLSLVSILRAKSTKSPIVTEPIILAQGYPGLVIYSPIFKGDAYLGSTEVVIRLADLLKPIEGNIPLYSKNQYIQTGNHIIPIDDDIIFDNTGNRIIDAQGNSVEDPISQKYVNTKNTTISQDIVFADKTWHFKTSTTYVSEVNRRMIGYIGSSLFILLAITIFLLILQKRRRQLEKQVSRNTALIASIGDGLMICDRNGIIIFVNKKAEDLSGYSAKDALGKSYYDFWLLVDSKGTPILQQERPFHQSMIKKEVINITVTDHLFILRKDGTQFPLSSTISPVILNGKVDGSIMTFRDITKESEVDRMKTEFLSLVSHQLLTPTTAIKWISELLLKGKYGILNEKQIENIQNIHISNESTITLVSSLLNISRIESGRIIISPKPTNLKNLATEVSEELKNKIESKEQILSIESESGLPDVNIDPNLIKQIYKNLLTNAIKYTPAKGKISITINKEKEDIISKISDTGYGIPAEEKNKIFEKFYRGGNITGIEIDGNGLGLYLVKQLVDASGGKIWFESEINKGTTFYFSLPISGSKPKAGEVTIS
ncbi:MAG: ATP-binding protein [Candidatus Paceibacterota bacterium]